MLSDPIGRKLAIANSNVRNNSPGGVPTPDCKVDMEAKKTAIEAIVKIAGCDLAELLESSLAADKPVALVCHAPGALRHVKTPAGRPLVEGKRVTGFTNSEEEGVGLTDVVPFLVEDELKTKGGKFERTEDWGVFIVTDGLLTTGQNPAPSSAAAERLLERVRQKEHAV